jgi:putative DNA primase/helicase
MQRWFGYCLTGNVVEHAFVFGHGSGGDGKGTMLNTIAWIFNDYATVADMGTFIASKSERYPTDIAKLHGARLVTAQETQQGIKRDRMMVQELR